MGAQRAGSPCRAGSPDVADLLGFGGCNGAVSLLAACHALSTDGLAAAGQPSTKADIFVYEHFGAPTAPPVAIEDDEDRSIESGLLLAVVERGAELGPVAEHQRVPSVACRKPGVAVRVTY